MHVADLPEMMAVDGKCDRQRKWLWPPKKSPEAQLPYELQSVSKAREGVREFGIDQKRFHWTLPLADSMLIE